MAEIKLRKRLIYSGEVFVSLMGKGWGCTELANLLRSCREVDAVEVVRCKDCGLCVETADRFGKGLFCRKWNRDWQRVQADDFCSYGERRYRE